MPSKFRVVAALAFLGTASAAHAEGYPAHAVSLVVPYAVGGPTDTIARIMAARMSPALGQTVVVENTTGAGGSIGVGKVARAAPDGYALSIGNIGSHVFNGAIYQLSYDLLKDLEPVALIASNPQIIVSKNAVPAKDLKGLLAWVKSNQDKISLGTGGAGTAAHISGVYFQKVTGTQLQLIQAGIKAD
jgi:tripartite-type tricarboxylate transporter receptor subunit TctC